MTLIGFSFVVVNFITLLYYNPTFDQACPSWVYVSYAAGLFLYQTFDACDGQQARRTGQSGPLGELFDHCVDAVNTTLGTLIFAGASNMGTGWPVLISLFATLSNFYLSTWEEYHTGTLFLSVISGPVEGILLVVGLMLLLAFTGPAIFQENFFEALRLTPILESVGVSVKSFPQYIANATVMDSYMVFGGVALLFNILSATANVIKSCRKQKKPVYPALSGTFPYLGFLASLIGWAVIAPEVIENAYLLLPFTLGTGFIVALSVGRIITAHVTDQEFPPVSFPMFFPAIAIAINMVAKNEYGFSADQLENLNIGLVWASLGSAASIYGFFVSELVVEITDYLDIWCLSIKHPKVTKEDKNK